MSTSRSITSPIAMCKRTEVKLNLPWFVECTEYGPVPATFEPLVNGERAFGALYDAIMNANVSIDYVCWGFQPSMYFKRTGNPDELCIGDLLIKKSKKGVKVRVICWYMHLAQFMENPTPGDNTISWFEKGRQNRDDEQRKLDQDWYLKARLKNTGANNGVTELIQREWDLLWYGRDKTLVIDNIEFVTRGFGFIERVEIAWQLLVNGEDQNGSINNKFQSTVAMSAAPTHHQKMVLIDYESPDEAVGFVMGHNTLDAYWDKDDHSYTRRGPREGRNGQTPRQDISSKVTGPILAHLNDNFCEAWDRETGGDLLGARAALFSQLKPRRDAGAAIMAQLLRTQQQDGVHDIRELYLKATNNVTNYIYMENQYFRWEPIASAIKTAVQKQQIGGRSHAEHGSIHVFVVTNSSDEGMGDGSMNTYRMLDSLGRKDVLPGIAKLERNEALDRELDAAKLKTTNARQSLAALDDPRIRQAYINPKLLENLKIERRAEVEAAQQRQEELEATIPFKKSKAINFTEIQGLKVHICTLVAPDSPPDDWMPVYIHSKLTIIDDVFTTLGSANINIRSMEVDSELNICHEHPELSKKLRQQLWNIHTNHMGAQDDVEDAFDIWLDIIEKNKSRQRTNKGESIFKGLPPYASLIEFYRESVTRTNLD
ncbi:phospholipase D-like domain-containing protein [Pseudomonas ficuserectae]|uniref:Phospholipase D/transphosphatidylase n=4 Tax=Pseudomonas syringae group TaxID=136849 RepID=A0A7Z6Y2Z9_PSESF|nr:MULTISPECIES: phospholipase D-like domain-containing protein [Pseudomonas syringae group]ARA83382.1 phospholipase [Pseudomonas amygdali pv. lachrymans]KKY57157.1 phospholipase [Pseudomonas amygdali pv. lachrymans]KPC01548.1 Phospholipase D/transphosphatidylase [Pseudomonas amygdali pv. lachrymans]MDU8459569.1 phospholipase D-like domain-containing protein [Pseudomonas syringae group sp. J254-4]RMM44457.1 Phospholipase D/transphosphatidylase [Pseudomonas amygdali pv. lachrymans]